MSRLGLEEWGPKGLLWRGGGAAGEPEGKLTPHELSKSFTESSSFCLYRLSGWLNVSCGWLLPLLRIHRLTLLRSSHPCSFLNLSFPKLYLHLPSFVYLFPPLKKAKQSKKNWIPRSSGHLQPNAAVWGCWLANAIAQKTAAKLLNPGLSKLGEPPGTEAGRTQHLLSTRSRLLVINPRSPPRHHGRT